MFKREALGTVVLAAGILVVSFVVGLVVPPLLRLLSGR